MKVAVFSDTHGVTSPMVQAVRETTPDVLVHLGDYERDAEALLRAFPDIPLYHVCGNCDYAAKAPARLVVQFGPVTALLTHGHLYHVDFGRVDSLVYAAQESGAQLALFGHTHTALHEDVGGVKVVNPGIDLLSSATSIGAAPPRGDRLFRLTSPLSRFPPLAVERG